MEHGKGQESVVPTRHYPSHHPLLLLVLGLQQIHPLSCILVAMTCCFISAVWAAQTGPLTRSRPGRSQLQPRPVRIVQLFPVKQAGTLALAMPPSRKRSPCYNGHTLGSRPIAAQRGLNYLRPVPLHLSKASQRKESTVTSRRVDARVRPAATDRPPRPSSTKGTPVWDHRFPCHNKQYAYGSHKLSVLIP